MIDKGLFITFEGVEGSGKSTHVGLLASKLKESGMSIKVTREPGGTRIGEKIRDLTLSKDNVDLTAVAECYLMAASRAQHVREIIRPAISAGDIVICDRFIDSSLAYQGYGRLLGEEEVFLLNKSALDGVFPDITVFLNIPSKLGLERRKDTGKINRLDLQQTDFYKRVEDGYRNLAKKNLERYFTVDSSLHIEDVSEKIWNYVRKKIEMR